MKGCALEAVSALSHKKNKGGFERMKKNLKKVISAVLALALAMSSFVAMTTSAATFADVADTASYAEAVNALAALGAIAGTGDGTFKPDDNITRAEAATMVVAAQNLSADAQNAGSTSQFADVNEQAKWATGYVNVGVAQGYISGTSATTFNPLDNVTYAQLLTMLTRILGYGDFAVSRGGYPNGYLTAASTAGILTGVSAAAEEPITRAQAAQLIWNAVQAPMLDITTFTGSVNDTELQKMDGRGTRDFKTVLSEKFNAYVLDVTVEETSKQGTLEIGTIAMRLTSSTQYDPENEVIGSKAYKNEVAVGKTDAEEYVFASAKVVAEYNEDDEWKLIYFAPTGKVATKTIDGTLVNDNAYVSGTPNAYNGVAVTTTMVDPDGTPASGDEYASSTGKLRIKKSATASRSSATEYNLQDASLYVNGVFFCDVDATNADAVAAMLAESTGDVTLVQNENIAGRVYNKIMMDYYVVASVNQVKTSAKDTEIRISGLAPLPSGASSIWATPGTSLTVDADELAEGEVIVNVTKAGAAADLSALAKNDVVALKYNIKQALTGFGVNFNRIDILATTDVVSGQYGSFDTDEDKYIVGGVAYDYAKSQSVTLGNTYTFRLDPFGRLFDAEEEATNANYAILERYVNASHASNYSAEYAYMDVVTLDGQSKRLYIDTGYATTADSVMTTAFGSNVSTKYLGKAIANGGLGVAMGSRIIEYKVKTSTGRVNNVAVSTNVDTFTGQQYNASTNKLSKVLASSAVVLDATKYDVTNPSVTDYKASSLSSLVGSVDYDGVLVHKSTSNNEWAYLIITVAGSTYSTTSDFVVVAANASSANAAIVDDEDVYQLSVMQNGDNAASKLNISTNAKIYAPVTVGGTNFAAGQPYSTNCAAILKEGAVFFYTTDSYGLVDRIDVVLLGGYNYDALIDTVTGYDANSNGTIESGDIATTMGTLVKLPASSEIKSSDWFVNVNEKACVGSADNVIQLFVAPVMTVGSNSVSFGSMEGTTGSMYMNVDRDYSFSLSSDAKIYEYNLDEAGTGNAMQGGAFAGITVADAEADGKAWVTGVPSNAKTNFNGMLQYAFVMTVDGVITNALVINK